MRRATLQLEPVPRQCEAPGDCGEVCHCGLSMEDHPLTDPPHTPTPMLCWPCSLELDPFDVLEEP